MGKHIFWGVILLVLGFLGAYVGLVVTDHTEEAKALGGGALAVVGGGVFLLWMYFLVG